MKVLTICEGGVVRSTSLARVLRTRRNDPSAMHDAIAIAGRWNTRETINMLCEWAELIVVMETYMAKKYIEERFRHKLKICDVGPDRFGWALHPELQGLVRKWAIVEGLLVEVSAT
jgi:predicted protein tyrosine phosphatase